MRTPRNTAGDIVDNPQRSPSETTSERFESGNEPLEWAPDCLRIGCPVWACKEWQEVVYPSGTKSSEFLTWYSSLFATVEGNSTFYSVPGPESFVRWCDQTATGFRFCFKFPRSISHDHRLVGCDDLLREWLDRLSILAKRDRLGPTFLQLAPSFSPSHFSTLSEFLSKLPREWPWAVEVRHRDWFDTPEWEDRLDAMLSERGIDRVIFDSRPLNSMDASDSTEAASQQRKPKLPLRVQVTGTRPMVRLIGRNDFSEVTEYWDEWAERIAGWISQGFQPWVFTHAPDDKYAPGLVEALHSRVRDRVASLGPARTLENVIAARARSELRAKSDQPIQLKLF